MKIDLECIEEEGVASLEQTIVDIKGLINYIHLFHDFLSDNVLQKDWLQYQREEGEL